MNRRHSHQGPTSLLVACAALALAATPACNASEPRGPDAAQEPAVRTTPQPHSAQPAASFTLFESGQVRPLALSPDKQLLFAVNTPDDYARVQYRPR